MVWGGSTSRDDPYACRRAIYVYNIDSERWRKFMIPGAEKVPPETYGACGAALSPTQVYVFGGHTPYGLTNELWKLTVTSKNKLTWQEIEFANKKNTPSPRVGAVAWEHSKKFWTFSGVGRFPRGYSNRYGEWRVADWLSTVRRYVCNQLSCYDPNLDRWENIQSFGAVPCPRCESAATEIGDAVWLYGGTMSFYNYSFVGDPLSDLYSLNMKTLTWTQIHSMYNVPQPEPRFDHTLTAINENQIILHGGNGLLGQYLEIFSDTWIFDISSMSWRKHVRTKDHPRSLHTACRGRNDSIIILGGIDNYHQKLNRQHADTFHIVLDDPGPKNLQDLALKAVHLHRHHLNPRKYLPDQVYNRLCDM